jgi:hypothetical protein
MTQLQGRMPATPTLTVARTEDVALEGRRVLTTPLVGTRILSTEIVACQR